MRLKEKGITLVEERDSILSKKKILNVITSALCISLKINAFISYMFYYKLLLPNNMRSLKLQHKVVL